MSKPDRNRRGRLVALSDVTTTNGTNSAADTTRVRLVLDDHVKMADWIAQRGYSA
ncbi:MAG: hypothetical protein ACR2I1_04250 [Propionibacteriaceae bacterium]